MVTGIYIIVVVLTFHCVSLRYRKHRGVGITDIRYSRTRWPSGVGLGEAKKILGLLILEQGGQ